MEEQQLCQSVSELWLSFLRSVNESDLPYVFKWLVFAVWKNLTLFYRYREELLDALVLILKFETGKVCRNFLKEGRTSL